MIPIKDYTWPRRRMPWVTWGIIAVNIAVFLYQVSLGPAASAFMFAYAVVVITLLFRSLQRPPAIPTFHVIQVQSVPISGDICYT